MTASWEHTDASLALKMEKVQTYLKQQGIFELFEDLTTALIYHLPDDSKAFLMEAIRLLRDQQLAGPDAKEVDLKSKLNARDYSIPDGLKQNLTNLNKDASAKRDKAKLRPKSAKPSLSSGARTTPSAGVSSPQRQEYQPSSATASPVRASASQRPTSASHIATRASDPTTSTIRTTGATSSTIRPGSASRQRPSASPSSKDGRVGAGSPTFASTTAVAGRAGHRVDADPVVAAATSGSKKAVEAAISKAVAEDAKDELEKELQFEKAMKTRRPLPREQKKLVVKQPKKQLPLRTVKAKKQAAKAQAALKQVAALTHTAPGRPPVTGVSSGSDTASSSTDDDSESEDVDNLADEIIPKLEKAPQAHRTSKQDKKAEKVAKKQAVIAKAKAEVKAAKKAEKEVRRADHIIKKAQHEVKKGLKPRTATNTKAPIKKEIVKSSATKKKEQELAAQAKAKTAAAVQAASATRGTAQGKALGPSTTAAAAVAAGAAAAGGGGGGVGGASLPSALRDATAKTAAKNNISAPARLVTTASATAAQQVPAPKDLSGSMQSMAATKAAIQAEKAAAAARKANKPPKYEIKPVTREEQKDLEAEEVGLVSQLKVSAPPPKRVAKVRAARPGSRSARRGPQPAPAGKNVVVPGMSPAKVPGAVNMKDLPKAMQTPAKMQALKAKQAQEQQAALQAQVQVAQRVAVQVKNVQAAQAAAANKAAVKQPKTKQEKKIAAGLAQEAKKAQAAALAPKQLGQTGVVLGSKPGSKPKVVSAKKAEKQVLKAVGVKNPKRGIAAKPAVRALLGSDSSTTESSSISDSSVSSVSSGVVQGSAPAGAARRVAQVKKQQVAQKKQIIHAVKTGAIAVVPASKVTPAAAPAANKGTADKGGFPASSGKAGAVTAAANKKGGATPAAAPMVVVVATGGVPSKTGTKATLVSATNLPVGLTSRPKKQGGVATVVAAGKGGKSVGAMTALPSKGRTSQGSKVKGASKAAARPLSNKAPPPQGIDSSSASSASTDSTKLANKAVRAQTSKTSKIPAVIEVETSASSESDTTDAESEIDESASSDETDDLAAELGYAPPVSNKAKPKGKVAVAGPPVKVKRVRASKPDKPRHMRKNDAPTKAEKKAGISATASLNSKTPPTSTMSGKTTAGKPDAIRSSPTTTTTQGTVGHFDNKAVATPSGRPTSAGFSRGPAVSKPRAHFGQQQSAASASFSDTDSFASPLKITNASAVESVQPFTSHSKPASIRVSARPGSAKGGRGGSPSKRPTSASQGKQATPINPKEAQKQADVAKVLGPVADSYVARPTQFQRLFATMDSDRDGSISMAEFVAALKKRSEILGFDEKTAQRLGEIAAFKKFDTNGDGRISWDEFTAAMQGVTEQVNHERKFLLITCFEQHHDVFSDVFKQLHKDSNKSVLVSDMIKALSAPAVLQRLGLTADQVNVLTTAEAFKAVDGNKDGRITWEELLSSVGELHENVKKTQIERIGEKFDKQSASWKKLFDAMDRNRSGDISFAELVRGLQEHSGILGLLKRDMSVFSEIEAFKRFDTNGDGHLTWDEFKSGMISLTQAAKKEKQKKIASSYKTKPSQYKKLFQQLDKNGDGSVSFAEFVMGMKTLGGALGLSEADAKSMAQMGVFKAMDENGDGLISWPEFQKGMNAIVAKARNAKLEALGKVYNENILEFKDIFTSLSKDKKGGVNMLQFVKALKKHAGLIGLSPDDIDVLREADVFKKIDKDNNGVITWSEFRMAFAQALVSVEKESKEQFVKKFTSMEEEFRAIFDSFDRNRDGSLSSLEFLTGLKKNPELVKKLGGTAGAGVSHMDLFKKADRDGSGSISWAEFSGAVHADAGKVALEAKSKLATALQEKDKQQDIVKQLFAQLDTNGDGRITTIELVKGAKKNAELSKIIQQNGGDGNILALFKAADRDESGSITLEEFRSYLEELRGKLEEERKASIADAFTERQREFRDIFNKLDKTRSGKIGARDFVQELKSTPVTLSLLGIGGANALSELDLFKKADRDNSGFVTWDEFSRTMEGLALEVQKDRNIKVSDAFAEDEVAFHDVFNKLDKNKDGFVTADELALGIQTHPLLKKLFEGDNIKQAGLFKHADKDKNGKLSFAEFKAEMLSIRSASMPERVQTVTETYRKKQKNFEKVFDRVSEGQDTVAPARLLAQLKKEGASLGLKPAQVNAIGDTREFHKANKKLAVQKQITQIKKADANRGTPLQGQAKKQRQEQLKELSASAPEPEQISHEEFKEMMSNLQPHRETKKKNVTPYGGVSTPPARKKASTTDTPSPLKR